MQGINLTDLILKARKQDLNDAIENYGREGFSYGEVKNISGFKRLEKGCKTYIEGEKYPMSGAFQPDRVEAVRQFKHVIPMLINSFNKHKITTALYLFFNWKDYLEFVHHGMRVACYPNPDQYCRAVREVHRVLSGKGVYIDQARDILCAILENDTAYRYRFQDIVSMLDKNSHNISCELGRLIEEYENREIGGNGTQVSKFLKKINWYFIVDRLTPIIKDLNIEELKLAPNDIYWTNGGYPEYNFRGLNYDVRHKEYLQTLMDCNLKISNNGN